MAAMKEKDFEELLESVKEIGLMEKGEIAPSREFVVERKPAADSSNLKTFAICLSSKDEELIRLKIYQVIMQPRHKTCTVVDERDETTVCPIEWFLPVEFPSNVERLLEETETALA